MLISKRLRDFLVGRPCGQPAVLLFFTVHPSVFLGGHDPLFPPFSRQTFFFSNKSRPPFHFFWLRPGSHPRPAVDSDGLGRPFSFSLIFPYWGGKSGGDLPFLLIGRNNYKDGIFFSFLSW